MVAAAPAKTVLDRITGYAEGVISGEIVAGELVKHACKRHINDLETGPERGLWFDEDAADRVIRLFSYLKHSKGRWAGESFVLADWQVFIVGSVFGWKRADGTRRFRQVHNEIARKNGKTTMCAGVGLYLAFADGEAGAEVYAAATKRDQAKICWSEARNMVKKTPALSRLIQIKDSTSNLSSMDLGSKFEPLGRDADNQQGLNVHGAVIDELHIHSTSDLVDVLETAVGAREQPLIWYITTAGAGQTGTWWEKRSYAVSVVEGLIEDDGLFVYIATLDKGDDWTDEAVWIKANPNLNVSVSLDYLRESCKTAQQIPSKQNAFRRLNLNQPTEQSERWIDMAQWDDCGAEPVTQPGDRCFAGLDMASTIDLSAAVALFPRDDGTYDVLCRFWRPEDTILEAEKRDGAPYRLWAEQGFLQLTDGSMMSDTLIADDLLDWLSPYQVLEFPFDMWNARGAAARVESAGGQVVGMAQGFQTFSGPCHTLEGLLASGKIRHGNHPILRWMAAQVQVKHGPNDSIRPFKPDGSGIRDDGIVALLMALARAMVHQPVAVSEPRSWTFEELPA